MTETIHGFPVRHVDGSPPPKRLCDDCKHFHGWMRIAVVDGKDIGWCGVYKTTPELVVRGFPCDGFEAGEHWEYT